MSQETDAPGASGIRSKEDVIAMAECLARPVVRSLLPLDQACATIAAAVGRGCRLGFLDAGDPQGLIETAEHILNLHIGLLEDKRLRIVCDIERVVPPMITRHEAIGRIRAEAHDINAAVETVCTEAEVERLIVHLLYQARARINAGRKPPPRARPYYG